MVVYNHHVPGGGAPVVPTSFLGRGGTSVEAPTATACYPYFLAKQSLSKERQRARTCIFQNMLESYSLVHTTL